MEIGLNKAGLSDLEEKKKKKNSNVYCRTIGLLRSGRTSSKLRMNTSTLPHIWAGIVKVVLGKGAPVQAIGVILA